MVAAIWRPLAVSGRVQQFRHVALERDLQLVPIRFEQDRLDQRSDGFCRARAALLALQRQTEATNGLCAARCLYRVEVADFVSLETES
jgi:hypothetical protein